MSWRHVREGEAFSFSCWRGGSGSLGKWILFSDASTHVRGLTAHYSGPGPLRSPSDGWQGLLGGGEVGVSGG